MIKPAIFQKHGASINIFAPNFVSRWKFSILASHAMRCMLQLGAEYAKEYDVLC